jgi:hypothetical protein
MNQLQDNSNHIYYNIDIRKPDDGKDLPYQAQFNETRVEPVLYNPSDYELAIVRFSIPAQNIPIFLWKENSFSVSIKYLTFTFTTVLQFIPNSSGGSYDYYGKSIWNYQDLIDSINVGLLASFNAFVAGTPAFGGKPTLPPYMIYTASTELCALVAPIAYDTTIANPVYIYFNNNLSNYFPALPNFGTADLILTKWIRVKNNFNNKSTIGGNDYYTMTEEYSTLFLWNDLQKILLETDTIPTLPELLGSQTNKTRKIITDFEPLSSINDRSTIQFFPQGALRFYDLISNYPLTNMNVKIYWADKAGTQYPIYLNNTDNLTIKIYFKRKGVMVSY